jgi:hypothetical protein
MAAWSQIPAVKRVADSNTETRLPSTASVLRMVPTPQLLVEWSSPWQEFLSAIQPALRRSPPVLLMEARAGLFPWRGLTATVLIELMVLGIIAASPSSTQLVTIPMELTAREVIYFSADELPQTQDSGGSHEGARGKNGGRAIAAKQVIKVSRGEPVREKISDAPDVSLPRSDSQLANLLSYRELAGPAPADALSLRHATPSIVQLVVPPPPKPVEHQARVVPLAPVAVVPPPPELPEQNILSSPARLRVTAAVVPPPVSAPPKASSTPARLLLPTASVVAPRPEIGAARRSVPEQPISQKVAPPPVELKTLRERATATFSATPSVAPPPVEVRQLRQRSAAALVNANVAAPTAELTASHRTLFKSGNAAVVPPPPATAALPDKGSGNSSAGGVVISSHAGEKPGAPVISEKAILAMSPSGATLAGTGGGNSGSGSSSGPGPGSAATVHSGSGAFIGGAGTGSAKNVSGNSSTPGPGGAGNLSQGSSRVSGVSISAGGSIVNLGSFGPAPPPATLAKSDVGIPGRNGITVVASPRSGGALNFYGALKGDRVYTIYLKTPAGPAVMQLSDPTSVTHLYDTELIPPVPVRTNLLPGTVTRLIVGGVLDRAGQVTKTYVLQSDDAVFEQQVINTLPDWKFTPALRKGVAVEVNIILGFGVDTK